MTRVAIVGMACRYPDASAPAELWENMLAGRRAFRRLPDERMRLADYWSPDPDAPDRFYARTAAVMEGYAFDRIGYKIAGSTYRSTDLTHWLALDMAARALADAGFPEAEGMPRDRTAVIVGNTLTGEFTRANVMRLRWPYVRRTLAGALGELGWDGERTAEFLAGVEERYKSPFPPIDEDSLAGGLSNTIAGRICNYFDLKGGGYTVDGACSSSLLSVATACKALRDGEADVAIAGGVDLSIDPFEVIGFAKTGALAKDEMRVYDRGSNGFWPGEGCGMVVLMREADAVRLDRRVYASVAGWGISSDGKGGITRPEVGGYRLALSRAYERAGFGIDTVALFEGHGTGTAVGDATELTALSQARVAADPDAAPAAIGTVKGMIGHTKAAAGVAGLIKAALAVHHQVLPPTTGCFDPHPVLTEGPVALRVLRKAETWPEGAAFRAGVTAMGFGGINTHIVLEGTAPRRQEAGPEVPALAASVQDVELLLVDAASPEELRERLAELAGWVPALSYAQLSDLAAALQRRLGDLPYRAAAVVSSPQDAERRLNRLLDALRAGETTLTGSDGKTFMGHAVREARIGYLFPGQGSGRGTGGGALRRRLSEVEEVYAAAALPATGDMVATDVAQPRIVTGSTAALRALRLLGLDAGVAVGHSLGEISALHWAGVLDERALLRIAGVRGRAMAEYSASGTMAGLGAAPELVAELIAGLPVVIAARNGPGQTVIAGTVDTVQEAGRRVERAGVSWARLPVSHAFHSPLVEPAADAFAARLADEEFGPVRRRVVSTITGEALEAGTDVRALLRRQITDPVLFAQAVELAAKDVDLFVEAGPGRVLTGLVRNITDVPAVALDTDSESLAGLLGVAGAAFAAGVPVRHGALFEGRLTRPLEIGASFSFLASPCEQAPPIELETVDRPAAEPAAAGPGGAADGRPVEGSSVDLLRGLAAERAELPLEMVHEDSKLLDELHLSSITVGQLLSQAARRLDLSVLQPPTNFATATIREMADTLDALVENGGAGGGPAPVADGAAAWARAFSVDLDELPLPAPAEAEDDGPWRLFGEAPEPAERLRAELERARVGPGLLVWLPPACGQRHLAAALEAAKAAAEGPSGIRLVLVQHGRGAAGLVKTVRQEARQTRVTIVHLPAEPSPHDVGRAVAEVAATAGFAEAHYDVHGVRRVPTLRALPVRAARERRPLAPGDVLLVTGGGKGITAECALAVASDTGAALAVMGRSDPETDPELAGNLRRMAAQGVQVRYLRADVTDPAQVRRAVEEAARELGPITGVLHGAGRNEPAALADLDMAEFQRTLAPKVDGLRAVLDAVGADRLRLLVTFGSIIGRAGLRGEAHYATANEWLAALTQEVADRNPGCRALCLEWSVWSGVGMGERLSVVEELALGGITAIHPDRGVEIMRRLVGDPDAPAVVVVSGRTGDIDTIGRDAPELPLLRFVAKPLVRYHGVELVTEVELNPGTDPYLADHLLDGNLLFPAVLGMEAMAQAAAAATGRWETPVIEDAEFLRPIVVPPEGTTVIRVAATVTDDDTVAVTIRSAETDFAAEHFRARLRFTGEAAPDGPPGRTGDGLPAVPLDPATELYGGLLFQGPRFHRLRRYHRAAARHVDADLAVSGAADWFAGFLPGRLLLGDPGMRDALMHGNQVCVPHATLLPIGIDRVHPCGDLAAGVEEVRYCAAERRRDGDTYVYDIAVRTGDGRVVERWEGLRLRAVRKTDGGGPWVAPLLGPYLERTLEDLTGARVAVAVEPRSGPGEDAAPDTPEAVEARDAVAAGRALGGPAEGDGRRTSVSRAAGLTLAVAAAGPVACDVAAVTAAEEPGTARTRAAERCLAEAGIAASAPLRPVPPDRDGWVVLAVGGARVATFVTTLRGAADPVVFAILAEGRS